MFQSPPVLSSPPFTSPPASVAGSELLPKVSVPEASLAGESDYSSVVDSHDYDSLFSFNWLTPLISDPENAQQDSFLPENPPQSMFAGLRAGNSQQSTLASFPQYSIPTGNIQPSALDGAADHSLLAGHPQQSTLGYNTQQPDNKFSMLAGTSQQTIARTPMLTGNPQQSMQQSKAFSMPIPTVNMQDHQKILNQLILHKFWITV